MYSRKNVEWLYLYYSGEKLDYIGYIFKINPTAIRSRIAYMKLPARPRGSFTKKVKERWLKEKHVAALRRLFEK